MDYNRRKNRDRRRKLYRTNKAYREKRKANARARMDKLRRKRGIPRASWRFGFESPLRSVGIFAVPVLEEDHNAGRARANRGLIRAVDPMRQVGGISYGSPDPHYVEAWIWPEPLPAPVSRARR